MSEDDQSFSQVRDRIDRVGLSGIEDFYCRQINLSMEKEINLAITGNSGTGKSSFINAVRE